MDVNNFLEKQEIEIEGSKYLISKIPAIQGQQIYGAVMKEGLSSGNIGMTYLSLETGLKLLSYAAYLDGDTWVAIEDEFTANVACDSIQKLIKLEAAMIRYNFGFLFDGTLQKVLEELRMSSADI